MNPNPPPHGERRPITTRDAGWARHIAHRLARAGVTPNAISIGGMIAGILAGVAFALTSHLPGSTRLWWIAGAAMMQLRLAANMFDGMVAVETKRTSAVGELYNEVPDRVSDACALIGLGYAAGGDIVLGYIAACLAIFVAYVRAMGKVAGAHQEFCGPLAKPQRMFFATVAALYAGLAPASWPLHPGRSEAASIVDGVLILIAAGCVLTALRRLMKISSALKQPRSNP